MVSQINTNNELPHPPILMLTTEGAAEMIAEAKKLGLAAGSPNHLNQRS